MIVNVMKRLNGRSPFSEVMQLVLSTSETYCPMVKTVHCLTNPARNWLNNNAPRQPGNTDIVIPYTILGLREPCVCLPKSSALHADAAQAIHRRSLINAMGNFVLSSRKKPSRLGDQDQNLRSVI